MVSCPGRRARRGRGHGLAGGRLGTQRCGPVSRAPHAPRPRIWRHARAMRADVSGTLPGPRSKDLGEEVAALRLAEEVALAPVATQVPEAGGMRTRLDALRRDLHVEGVGERQDRLDDRYGLLFRVELAHERLVQLEHVQGKLPQVGE